MQSAVGFRGISMLKWKNTRLSIMNSDSITSARQPKGSSVLASCSSVPALLEEMK
jgi:hypothetical protein